jgi:hypothetical protein
VLFDAGAVAPAFLPRRTIHDVPAAVLVAGAHTVVRWFVRGLVRRVMLVATKNRHLESRLMMKILVTRDPEHPGRTCRPAIEIQRLIDAGRLSLFAADATEQAESTDGQGNCHSASLALMTDLIVAGQAQRWQWVTGIVIPQGEHSWLERDGWAVDCCNGKLLFMDRASYRLNTQASDVTARDAKATKRWLRRCIAEEPTFG